MQTIAVFGASGRTGKPLVEKALSSGYAVRALVRTPEKLGITHPNLTVVKGNALSARDVAETLKGADGVISALGQDKASPPDFQTRATERIVEAMKKAGIKRFVSLTGGGVRDAAHDRPGFMDNLIVFIMKNIAGKGARYALLDGIAHADVVKKSGLDWTIVRGPMLTEDAEKGAYQVGHVGTVKGIKLTRADLADFMLKEFSARQHVGQMPFITNG